jgi:hypothetical protein
MGGKPGFEIRQRQEILLPVEERETGNTQRSKAGAKPIPS